MRWYLTRDERRPAPPAPPGPPVDDRRAFGVGTVVWLALLVAAVLGHGWLSDTGRTWWLWTCATGVALGFLALARQNRRRRSRGLGSPSGPSGPSRPRGQGRR